MFGSNLCLTAAIPGNEPEIEKRAGASKNEDVEEMNETNLTRIEKHSKENKNENTHNGKEQQNNSLLESKDDKLLNIENDTQLNRNDTQLYQNDTQLYQNDTQLYQNDTQLYQNGTRLYQNETRTNLSNYEITTESVNFETPFNNTGTTISNITILTTEQAITENGSSTTKSDEITIEQVQSRNEYDSTISTDSTSVASTKKMTTQVTTPVPAKEEEADIHDDKLEECRRRSVKRCRGRKTNSLRKRCTSKLIRVCLRSS